MKQQDEEAQFEYLPFGAGGAMELERGRRRARPASAPAPRRAGKRPPGGERPWPTPGGPRWPAPWPVYGWPYAVAPALPQGEPEPVPDEPASDDGPDAPPQDELPATLKQLQRSQRPAYKALGTMMAAIADGRSAGPGLYLIEFSSKGKRRAYSGQSDNIRRRLQQHQLCAQMLGFSLAGHQVYVAPLPEAAPAQRRAIEARLHDDMFKRSDGVLTNQRRELELALLGPQWA